MNCALKHFHSCGIEPRASHTKSQSYIPIRHFVLGFCFCFGYFCFLFFPFETEFLHETALAILELTLQTRLASNSQKSACLCLLLGILNITFSVWFLLFYKFHFKINLFFTYVADNSMGYKYVQ